MFSFHRSSRWLPECEVFPVWVNIFLMPLAEPHPKLKLVEFYLVGILMVGVINLHDYGVECMYVVHVQHFFIVFHHLTYPEWQKLNPGKIMEMSWKCLGISSWQFGRHHVLLKNILASKSLRFLMYFLSR